MCWIGHSAVTETKISISRTEVLGDVMMKLTQWSLRTRTSALGMTALISAATFLTGCGGETTPSGKVTGKVTYRGQPITEGEINFYSDKLGVAAKIPLDSAGHFELPVPIEVGEYKVSITPPPLADPSVGSPPPAMKEYANIPRKYRTDSLSGLAASIKQGYNELLFDLVP